jgi:hypothetical protein
MKKVNTFFTHDATALTEWLPLLVWLLFWDAGDKRG